jgi:ketosteroid isomerase-like protein
VLPFNGPMVTGKEHIRKLFFELMSKPGFTLTFEPTKVEVSKAHDLAYEIGTAQLTMNDAQDRPAMTPVKYVVVWKKDANQHWKALADVFNSDK